MVQHRFRKTTNTTTMLTSQVFVATIAVLAVSVHSSPTVNISDSDELTTLPYDLTESYDTIEESDELARILSEPALEYLCLGSRNGFKCADCRTMINCINGKAYPQHCSHGTSCAMIPEFGGGICYPGQPEECTCKQPNSVRRDPYDASSFFTCSSTGAIPRTYRCVEGLTFNPVLNQCDGGNNLPACTANGIFAFESDCTQYYTCSYTKGGWVQHPYTCPNNGTAYRYNEATKACEDPCTWTKEFKCTVEGRFLDNFDCSRYHICIKDVNNPEGYFHIEQICPRGYEWDSEASGGVGHCVIPSVRVSQCTPVIPNKCKIPEFCNIHVI